MVQWKLPKSLSQFVQCAERAARCKDRQGLAVLLVEKATYSRNIEDLVTSANTTATTTKKSFKKTSSKGSKKKPKRRTHKQAAGPKYPKTPKGYALAHGVNRGNSRKMDGSSASPHQPPLDVEAEDKGLLVFVQTTQCRREVWRMVFESFTSKFPTSNRQ